MSHEKAVCMASTKVFLCTDANSVAVAPNALKDAKLHEASTPLIEEHWLATIWLLASASGSCFMEINFPKSSQLISWKKLWQDEVATSSSSKEKHSAQATTSCHADVHLSFASPSTCFTTRAMHFSIKEGCN